MLLPSARVRNQTLLLPPSRPCTNSNHQALSPDIITREFSGKEAGNSLKLSQNQL